MSSSSSSLDPLSLLPPIEAVLSSSSECHTSEDDTCPSVNVLSSADDFGSLLSRYDELAARLGKRGRAAEETNLKHKARPSKRQRCAKRVAMDNAPGFEGRANILVG